MSFADIAILLGLLGGCIYATISVTLKIFAGIHLGVDTFIAEDFLSQHNSSTQCICLYKCDFCKTVFLRPCKMLVGNIPNP